MNLLTQDPQPAAPSYRLIPLTQGQSSKVSPEDYDWLMQWKWCAAWSKKTKSFYAMRSQYRYNRNPQCVRMSRQITNAPTGTLVDHKNHDTLDNQRGNLRVSTNSQNCANRKARGKSGLKGVWFDYKSWRAAVTVNGKIIRLGRFATAEEAHAAYCRAATDIHGEFAYLK